MHSSKHKNTILKNPKECLANIKRKITEKTKITNFVDLGETSAAFSGTVDNYDLYISLDVVKKRGKEYLYAYMEDHFEWYEWEYASQNEFEDKIVEYFCLKRKKHIDYILNKDLNSIFPIMLKLC